MSQGTWPARKIVDSSLPQLRSAVYSQAVRLSDDDLTQTTHSIVATTTVSRVFQGARRCISSALYRQSMVSAGVLS